MVTVASQIEPAWTDERVIDAVNAGDIDRYALLVDRYQAKAIHLSYSLLGSHAEAQDAAQEAFVSAFNALERFKKKAAFSSWFYSIVYNKCRDRLRQRKRAPYLVRLNAEEEEGGGFELPDTQALDPEASASDRELAAVIAEAVATLPEKQRAAFSLYHQQGQTLKETANIMGCRLGTVKTHIFRATRQLQKMLTVSLAEVSHEI